MLAQRLLSIDVWLYTMNAHIVFPLLSLIILSSRYIDDDEEEEVAKTEQ